MRQQFGINFSLLASFTVSYIRTNPNLMKKKKHLSFFCIKLVLPDHDAQLFENKLLLLLVGHLQPLHVLIDCFLQRLG